jgi:hypothetical protein
VAESSWPLPPNAVVTDTQYEQLLMGYVPSGVVGSPGDTTVITAPGSGTRIVTVRLGKYALVRGHVWYSGTSDVNLSSLAVNSSGNPRIDLVVLRYTRSSGQVNVAVVTGTPAASPTAPALTQSLTTSSVFEIPLAEVTVASGATTLTTGNIVSRESYLSRVPLIGATTPTAANTPGVYIGQTFDLYDATAGFLRRLWWNGTAWVAVAATQYVAEVTTTAGDISIAAGANTLLTSTSFTAMTGIRYRMTFASTYRFTVGNQAVLTLRHASGGSVTTGSTGVGSQGLFPEATADHTPVNFTRTFVATASGTYSVGVSCNFFTGSGTLFIGNNATNEMYMRVEVA